MTVALAITVVFRFLGAGLYVFLTGVLWGQRRTPPAGWATVVLMAMMGLWDIAYPPALAYPLAAVATLALGNLAWLAWRQGGIDLAAGLGSVWGLWMLGIAAGVHSPAAAIASLVPGLYLAWLFYWNQPFGLVLTNRSLFAVGMGIFAALYLLAVRGIAELVEREVGRFRWALELALLFWAGLLWIPFYAWISRFLSGRARVYSEFSNVMEQASLILDFSKRLRFLEEQIAGRFQLRRVILLASDALPENSGCNYQFPLRAENRQTGWMLVDTSPRHHLGDDEAVLKALAPQISQSIEGCRLIEEKIGLERQLARQENLAALGEAAATIAHEIKNPLSSIKTLARLMREDAAVNESHGTDLEFIESEVDRLDRSVRQLLGFSRANQRLNEDVDLTVLLVETCDLVGRQSRVDQIEVRCKSEPGLVLHNTNRELLQQAILNPVLNAAQASPKGGIVQVEARRGGRLVMTVRDQGPGIAPELRERIFDPFFTTRQRGTGLGLAIVRRNLRLLGGEITFEFPEGGGTVARIELG